METRRRIRLSLWAYAYEFENASIVDDATFDAECRLVNLDASTARQDMDDWWRKNFDPSSGMWIRSHPELGKLKVRFSLLFPTFDLKLWMVQP